MIFRRTTVSRGLPDKPHLDVPKREARALLKEWRAGLPEALDRIGRRHPKFREADPAAISAGKFLLNDAQLVVAREYGFSNWAELKERINANTVAGLLQEDFSSELMKLKLPTLIVWGDRDAICLRRDQAVLARNIPTSRLVVYSETGHALHWEEPEHFADDLVEFTIGLNRRAKSID